MGIKPVANNAAPTAKSLDGSPAVLDKIQPAGKARPRSLRDRVLPDAPRFQKPPAAPGKTETKYGSYKPDPKSGAGNFPAEVTTTLDGGTKVIVKGTPKADGRFKDVSSAQVSVPVFGGAGNVVAGTEGGRSSIFGAGTKLPVGRNWSLEAKTSALTPNDGTRKGVITTELGLGAKTGASEWKAGAKLIDAQEKGKSTTGYSLSVEVPHARFGCDLIDQAAHQRFAPDQRSWRSARLGAVGRALQLLAGAGGERTGGFSGAQAELCAQRAADLLEGAQHGVQTSGLQIELHQRAAGGFVSGADAHQRLQQRAQRRAVALRGELMHRVLQRLHLQRSHAGAHALAECTELQLGHPVSLAQGQHLLWLERLWRLAIDTALQALHVTRHARVEHNTALTHNDPIVLPRHLAQRTARQVHGVIQPVARRLGRGLRPQGIGQRVAIDTLRRCTRQCQHRAHMVARRLLGGRLALRTVDAQGAEQFKSNSGHRFFHAMQAR